MNRSKDQILLENLYNGIFQKQINENIGEMELQTPSIPENETDDYQKAEQMIQKVLDDIGSNYSEYDSDQFKDAVESVVVAMQHAPDELDETVQRTAFGLDNRNDSGLNDQEPSVVPGVGYQDDDEMDMSPFGECKTILKAYEKVIFEGTRKKKKKNKNNEYAICTASVGRENEEKYKRCKEKVKKELK